MVRTGTGAFPVPSHFGAEPHGLPVDPRDRSRRPGLLAGMLRLWHEHNRRLAQVGALPL